YELDIEEYAPDLLQYVSKETRKIMESKYWLVEINHDDVIQMFDPIIDKIIRMIHVQLSNNRETCSAIFLVGGFSDSKYLQKRVKQVFQLKEHEMKMDKQEHKVKTIAVPNKPIAAIVRGAVLYGLSL